MSLLVKRNGLVRPFRTMMSDLFDNSNFFDSDVFGPITAPAVNVKETDQEFVIELAAPGLSKEDFNIDVKNGVLSISSENETSSEQKEENYTRKEFSYSSFSRSFSLPENINMEDINALYKEGVLSVTLAKKEPREESPSRTISVS